MSFFDSEYASELVGALVRGYSPRVAANKTGAPVKIASNLARYLHMFDKAKATIDERANLIEHTFILRDTLRISLKLPKDLSETEARRIADWIKTLSY